MVSYIWFFLIIIGILFSLFSGRLDIINDSILTNGKEALDLMLSILPIIVLWTGIMKIAEEAGLLEKFARLMHPVLSRLFPSVSKNHPALGYIASNIGNLATVAGTKEPI